MWYSPKHQTKVVTDINKELAQLVGELDDDVAKITLAQFLYRNLGFTTELLSGMKPIRLESISDLKARLMGFSKEQALNG